VAFDYLGARHGVMLIVTIRVRERPLANGSPRHAGY
jgi:hypothetical protein